MNSDAIRAVLAGHQPHGTRRAVELLLAEVERQQEEINELRQAALGHERRIADVNRNIGRLKGVHGA